MSRYNSITDKHKLVAIWAVKAYVGLDMRHAIPAATAMYDVLPATTIRVLIDMMESTDPSLTSVNVDRIISSSSGTSWSDLLKVGGVSSSNTQTSMSPIEKDLIEQIRKIYPLVSAADRELVLEYLGDYRDVGRLRNVYDWLRKVAYPRAPNKEPITHDAWEKLNQPLNKILSRVQIPEKDREQYETVRNMFYTIPKSPVETVLDMSTMNSDLDRNVLMKLYRYRGGVESLQGLTDKQVLEQVLRLPSRYDQIRHRRVLASIFAKKMEILGVRDIDPKNYIDELTTSNKEIRLQLDELDVENPKSEMIDLSSYVALDKSLNDKYDHAIPQDDLLREWIRAFNALTSEERNTYPTPLAMAKNSEDIAEQIRLMVKRDTHRRPTSPASSLSIRPTSPVAQPAFPPLQPPAQSSLFLPPPMSARPTPFSIRPSPFLPSLPSIRPTSPSTQYLQPTQSSMFPPFPSRVPTKSAPSQYMFPN